MSKSQPSLHTDRSCDSHGVFLLRIQLLEIRIGDSCNSSKMDMYERRGNWRSSWESIASHADKEDFERIAEVDVFRFLIA